MTEKQTAVIVDQHGKPARQSDKACPNPKCGKGPEFRKPANTFGGERFHCVNCGSDW